MTTHDSQSRIRYVGADTLAEETDSALIILDISREEVASGDSASVLARLATLTADADTLKRYRECLAFQVRGYDEDPRVLFEIPEVRNFFAALTQEWPHWLWFLQRKVGAMALFMSLVCTAEAIRDLEGGLETEFLDVAELKARLMDLFTRSHPLLEAFGVHPGDMVASAQSAANEITGG